MYVCIHCNIPTYLLWYGFKSEDQNTFFQLMLKINNSKLNDTI